MIKKYNIILLFFSSFIIFVSFISMDVAKDRKNYLRFFEDPTIQERFELGFSYYAKLLSMFFSPEISVVITILIIYLLLGLSWNLIVKRSYIATFLLFIFVAFTICQYFLGTAIRHGLAASLAIFSSVRILQGKIWYFPLLLITPLLHYGALLYVIVFLVVIITKKLNWSLFKSMLILTVPVMLFAFEPLFVHFINAFGLPSYYLGYIFDDFGKTERFRSYSMILFLICLFALLNTPDSLERRLVYSGFPFLIYYLLSDISFFPRLLMPMLFFAMALCINVYAKRIKTLISPFIWYIFLIMLDFLAIFYALNQYNLI